MSLLFSFTCFYYVIKKKIANQANHFFTFNVKHFDIAYKFLDQAASIFIMTIRDYQDMIFLKFQFQNVVV